MQSITPAERDRLTNYLAVTRERLLNATRSLSSEQLGFKPSSDRWSVAENLEHLTIVENRVLGRIENALQASDSSKRSAWEGRDEALLKEIRSRSPRVQAPEIVQPTGTLEQEELFRQFEAARRRTGEFAVTTNADLRGHFFPHPLFGEMDCYQWLLAMGAHYERHLGQIEEVLASACFPRAAVAV